MKAHISYRQISKSERKVLAAEAMRHSRFLQATRYAMVVVPISLGSAAASEWVPHEDLIGRLVVGVGAALLGAIAVWEIFGRPKLRAEVERLKNA